MMACVQVRKVCTNSTHRNRGGGQNACRVSHKRGEVAVIAYDA